MRNLEVRAKEQLDREGYLSQPQALDESRAWEAEAAWPAKSSEAIGSFLKYISADLFSSVLSVVRFYFRLTTPIFSSALKYSTTISSGTGPYSAETASRICCALRLPSAKFNVS